MSHTLLLGAGFSHNWGGWLAVEVFEYLLGCPEITRDESLRSILWQQQGKGGFETALEALQAAHRQDPRPNQQRLEVFQRAITQMFGDMNNAFLAVNDFEFQNFQGRMVKTFLARFDAIFSLNQDVLIEYHYKDNHDIALTAPSRWNSIQLPGMHRIPPEEPLFSNSWARATWVPEADYQIASHSQPFFKLHGSSNWRSNNGGALLVIGGQKAREINLHPILARYAREFEEHLCAGGTKLMVIGYGFRDDHINEIIVRAAEERALKIFIISPQGSEQARALNLTRRNGQVIARTRLEEVFERSLIGASRRLLRNTFGGDTAEFNKVQRFFQ